MLYKKLGFLNQNEYNWAIKYTMKDKYDTEYTVVRLPNNTGYAFFPKGNEALINYANTLDEIEKRLNNS